MTPTILNEHKPFFLVCAGKPGSGKTTLIRYIMAVNNSDYSATPFRYGVVLCKTSFNNAYAYLPSEKIHGTFDINAIINLMRIQAKTKGKHRAFIIFDDCLSDKEFRTQVMIDLVTQFRHYNISIIISTQYPSKIPTTFRECATHAAIFYQRTALAIQSVFHSYGQIFNNYDEFKSFLIKNAGDYKFIFYDGNSSGDVAETYKIMKAPDIVPDFDYVF